MSAVRTTDPTVLSQLDRLATKYPDSEVHRKTLQSLDSDFVYASPISSDSRFSGVWLALIRFSSELEDRFGIYREVAVIYSPHSDLQGRTISRISDALEHLPRERQGYETSCCFLWAPDTRLVTKLDQFSRTERVVLPLTSESPDQWLVKLTARLYRQDLYREKTFVTGDQFFGRRKLLSAIRNDLKNGKVVSVFGTRKTGKTSVLKEMVRASDADRGTDLIQVYVYYDLEHLPSVESSDPISELVEDLAEELRLELKRRGLRTKEIAEVAGEASLRDFRRALTATLQHPANHQLSLVIILDEIEHLCPPNVSEIKGNDNNGKVPQFFGVLRKLVQELDNFSFAVAGLAPAIVESGELFGRHNPLFQLAQTYFMAPFGRDESAELLSGIGRRLGLRWSERAIELAHRESGGHVVLLRELGASVWQNTTRTGTGVTHVSVHDVESAIPPYRRRVRAQISETLEHIRRYYPDEYELCEEAIVSVDGFQALAEIYPSEINRLSNLGVIQEREGRWVPTKVLELGWNYSTDLESLATRTSGEPEDLASRVRRGEGRQLEFESSVRVALAANVPENVIFEAIVKTVLAFMNADGGLLVVGVNDDGRPIGLKEDIEKSSNSKDRLLLFVTDKLSSYIGLAESSSVVVSWEMLEDSDVLLFDVPKSSAPVFSKKTIGKHEGLLYVRQNANTIALAGADLIAYHSRRFS